MTHRYAPARKNKTHANKRQIPVHVEADPHGNRAERRAAAQEKARRDRKDG